MHLCVTTFSVLGVQLYLKFSACDQQWFSMGYILCSLFTTVSTWIYPRFASRCHKQHSAVSCANCDFWYSIDTRVSDMHLASHETIVTQITIFMRPTWVLSAQGGPHVGPMYLAIGEFIPLHNVCLGCRSFSPFFQALATAVQIVAKNSKLKFVDNWLAYSDGINFCAKAPHGVNHREICNL